MPIEPLTQQQSWGRGKRPPPPPAKLGIRDFYIREKFVAPKPCDSFNGKKVAKLIPDAVDVLLVKLFSADVRLCELATEVPIQNKIEKLENNVTPSRVLWL